jgi:vitamin B12 transporter
VIALKNLISILFFFGILFPEKVISESKDTLSARFPEVSVTADRIMSNSVYRYNASMIINEELLGNRNSWGLSEVLSVSPGIHINDYGGLGGLKTISMRGTTSSQNIIMIDGVKINSSQSGISDLSIVPSGQFNNIEVVRGGLSAVYGGSAVGGVINMTNSGFIKEVYNASVQYGSFDEYLAKGKAEFGNKNMNESVYMEYKSSSGKYPFKLDDNSPEYVRSNSDFEMFSFSSLTRMNFNEWDLSGRFIGNISNRGIPGPVIIGQSINVSEVRLDEKTGLIILSALKQIDTSSSVYLALNANINGYNYHDKGFFGSYSKDLSANFTNRDIGLAGRYNFLLSDFNFRIGLETGFSDLRGNQLDRSVDSYVKRMNYAVYANAESNFKIDNFSGIDYFLGLRFDDYSDVYGAVSGFAGTVIGIQGLPLKFRGQVSHNFRPPAFNEMYYMNYGNSDLLPEKSVNINYGIIFDTFNNINFTIDGFHINTDDQIIAVPKNQISWSAKNIRKVASNGVELSVRGELFNKKLFFDVSYTYQDVRDLSEGSINKDNLIVYVPPEIVSFSLIYNFCEIKAGCFGRYSNFYYSLPDNSYESIIPEYLIIDTFISYNFQILNSDLEFRLDVKNILDEQYSVILNYPMPGRYFRAGVFFNY